MPTDKLTHTAVKSAKPAHRTYRMADGNSMYLLVKANGTKAWRLDYTHAVKVSLIARTPRAQIRRFEKGHENRVRGPAFDISVLKIICC